VKTLPAIQNPRHLLFSLTTAYFIIGNKLRYTLREIVFCKFVFTSQLFTSFYLAQLNVIYYPLQFHLQFWYFYRN